MQHLKTIKLLKKLSSAQIKVLKNRLQHHKRKSLNSLFAYLIKNISNIEKLSKENAFEQTFSSSYTKEKDYLLRNELRILNEEIHKFLVIEQTEKLFKTSPRSLDTAIYECLFELDIELENDIKKSIKLAEKDLDLTRQIKLNNILFEDCLSKKEISGESLKDLYQILLSSRKLILNEFQRKWHESDQKIKYIERYLNIYNQENIIQHSITPDLNQVHDPIAKYFQLKAEYYKKTSAENKSEHNDILYKALEELEKVKHVFHKYNSEKAACLSNIGLGFFFEGNYMQATEAFKKALIASEDANELPHPGVILNYSSSLLKSDQHEKVLDLLEKYKHLFEHDIRFLFRYECLLSMAHIFSGSHEKAFELVPENIHQRPYTEYYYFRFIYVIVFYCRKDVESADREVLNFKRIIQYKGLKDTEVSHTIYYYDKFFKILLKGLPKKEQIEDLLKLKTEIHNKENNLNKKQIDYLPNIWLKKELENQIN